MRQIIWKTFVYTFLVTQIIMLALCSSIVANFQDIPTVEELDQPQNVSDSLPISLHKTAVKSRESAIALLSINLINGEVSFASGTYIEYKGHYFIMTAAHAVQTKAGYMLIVTRQGEYSAGGIIYRSEKSDFAIVEAPRIDGIEAVDIEKSIPTAKKWAKSLEVLDPILYTGYPNATGPLTIDGKIMGFTHGVVYVNTYAWSGASGSAVFDEKGNIIGIISALEVGDFGDTQIPIENSIIVRPTYLVDWAEVFKDYHEEKQK